MLLNSRFDHRGLLCSLCQSESFPTFSPTSRLRLLLPHFSLSPSLFYCPSRQRHSPVVVVVVVVAAVLDADLFSSSSRVGLQHRPLDVQQLPGHTTVSDTSGFSSLLNSATTTTTSSPTVATRPRSSPSSFPLSPSLSFSCPSE